MFSRTLMGWDKASDFGGRRDESDLRIRENVYRVLPCGTYLDAPTPLTVYGNQSTNQTQPQ